MKAEDLMRYSRLVKINPLAKRVEMSCWLKAGNRLWVAWLLSLIALPIINYFWGDVATTAGLIISVVMQTTLVMAIILPFWGLKRTLGMAGAVAVLAWLAEAIGTATGWPFGIYHYTDKLQPQLAHVPLLIPLAWFMMLPPVWAVAYSITGAYRTWTFVVCSALALTAWDLFLDPQMVAWGYWIWAEPGIYFGIPLLNFFGWMLTGAIMTLVVRPSNLPVIPLLVIYAITWILETLGQLFFWGLPGPAIVGFVGMGIFVWLAVQSRREGFPNE